MSVFGATPEGRLFDRAVMPVDLRLAGCGDRLVSGRSDPRLAWRLNASRDGVLQLGYELQVDSDRHFVMPETSGLVEGQGFSGAPWPRRPLVSRERRYCRVRVLTDRGLTRWSEPLLVEAGLLHERDWIAQPVCPVSNVGLEAPGPVPLVRREFTVSSRIARARLYVSALGVHHVTINGRNVAPDQFEPGWTAYQHRLLYAAYDVTDLLNSGRNCLAGSIGDGWWRGELTWMARRSVYGDTTALLAQLEVELVGGSTLVVATDAEWMGFTGKARSADFYLGSDIDQRREPHGWRYPGFDDSSWERVATLDRPKGLVASATPPVRVVNTFPLEVRAGNRDKVILDCGQNLTGWIRLAVSGPEGAKIEVRHAEVLDSEGNLYTAALRNARAADSYILAGGDPCILEPDFTFHGFRYAEVIADAGVTIDRVEARVVYSDLPETGTFACSEPLLNKLWQNVFWSQRGNFLSIPTDCPQRDERLGWTGDIQVFGATACINADTEAFLSSWLEDLALEQRADGCTPSVIPNVIEDHEFAFGCVGWGDAATLLPWALYEAYGDDEILRRQLPSMKSWVDWCATRLGEDGLWTGDFQLGDWLDPGAPPDTPFQARTSGDYIANCYLAHSARILAKTLAILGDEDGEAEYRTLGNRVADRAWSKWREHALSTQTGCAMAIEFAIAPDGDRDLVGHHLAQLVDGGGARIGTGFLGTPLVLPALSNTGHLEQAYQLLLNRECPGWLFQVERGATTVWERWDAVRQDGTIHPGTMSVGEGSSMMSFNHYAYGAVVAWMYRTLAGIAPVEGYPGYRRIRFAPQPGGGLTHAKASVATRFGDAAIDWNIRSPGELEIELLIPPGAEGIFVPPEGWSATTSMKLSKHGALPSGRHLLRLTAIGSGG